MAENNMENNITDDAPIDNKSDVLSTIATEEFAVEPSSPNKKGRWKIALGAIVLALAAVYGGGCYYYSTHFPHGIYANGKSFGEKTVEEAEKLFTEDLESHNITLEEKERKEVIDAAEIGTKIAVGSQVKDLFESLNPYLWFTNTFSKKNTELKLDVTFDEKALKNKVDSLECFKKENITKPVSCYIKANETEFEIVPEVLGNKVVKDKLLEAIKTSMATCKNTINLVDQDIYKKPKYFSTDKVVTDALAKANKYTHATITHDFTYATETLDYSKSHKWIEISKNFDVTLNSSDVGDYLDSLCKKYNTMGSARRFKTANGNTITVAEGDYGWRIDFQKEKAKLIKELKKGEDVSRKPIYSYTAAVQSKETDLGDSYVEVSIDSQELWLFVDGSEIMNTSVVTGKPGFDTEKGVYGITYKKLDDYLEGYNADGTPYRSHVAYWMPFNGNQGLHDASWRDSFGGSIWKSNGSHGCVNCPSWAAEILYKYVDANFPVIIY